MLQPTVKISPKVKRVSLQRYLWSKVAFGDEIGFRELGGLFLNQLWLEKKSSTDVGFQKKFGRTLEVSNKILKEMNLSQGLSSRALNRLRKRALTELEAFLVPRRNYKAWKSKFDSSVILQDPKQPGVPLKAIPPKRFIGKGYGDKGTAKKPEFDASPAWQVVAMTNSSLQKRIENAKQRLETASTIKGKAFWRKELASLRKEHGRPNTVEEARARIETATSFSQVVEVLEGLNKPKR